MVALPALLAPITIETGTNDEIYGADGSGAITAAIAAGTYYLIGDGSADDILQAIETALEAVGANENWLVELTAGFQVRITNNDSAWAINWASGATTFDGALLGCSTNWSAGDGVYETGTGWPSSLWFGTHPVSFDSEPQGEGDVAQSRARSGSVYTVDIGGPYTVRSIGFSLEPKRKAYQQAGYVGQSWVDDFWPLARAGQTVRYCADQTDLTTYVSMVFDVAACTAAKPPRQDPKTALYSWGVGLLGAV